MKSSRHLRSPDDDIVSVRRDERKDGDVYRKGGLHVKLSAQGVDLGCSYTGEENGGLLGTWN